MFTSLQQTLVYLSSLPFGCEQIVCNHFFVLGAAAHRFLWGGLVRATGAQPDGGEDQNNELNAAASYTELRAGLLILSGTSRTRKLFTVMGGIQFNIKTKSALLMEASEQCFIQETKYSGLFCVLHLPSYVTG